jgi:hypothetical protein
VVYLNFLTLPCTVGEVDGFIAPTTASIFDLNFDLEEEEAGTVHGRLRVVLHQIHGIHVCILHLFFAATM